jgi:hypothetical protein
VRLPSGRDGFWVAILLAFVVAVAAAAPLVSKQGQSYVPYATAAVALGAGFLSGRDGVSAHPELTFPASPPLLH